MRFPVFALLCCAATATSQTRVPMTDAVTMSGKAVHFPQDFKQQTTVVIVGFTKESAKQTNEWATRISEMHVCNAQAEWYQVAVLESVPRLIRRFVDNAIRQNLPAQVRPHLVAVFSKEADWKAVTNYQAPDDA